MCLSFGVISFALSISQLKYQLRHRANRIERTFLYLDIKWLCLRPVKPAKTFSILNRACTLYVVLLLCSITMSRRV